MTRAGGESRANYLLKWEAIRSSREQGATSYDLWGLATGGIAHFKTGFGGREVRYIGAWDLVLDPLGRQVYLAAQRGRVALGASTPRASAARETPRPSAAMPGATRLDGSGLRPRTSSPIGTTERSSCRAATSTSHSPGRRTGKRAAGRPHHLVIDGRPRRPRPSRPWPVVGGGSAYIPRGPVSARFAAPEASRPARRGQPSTLPRAASTSSPATRRSRPRPATGIALREAGFQPDRGDPAVAPQDLAAARRARTRKTAFEGDREVDPPADPEGRE